MLLVQGAWAAGEEVARAAPVILSAANSVTNAVAAPWRDPFWPVGYLPAPDDLAMDAVNTKLEAVALPQSRWQEAYKRLRIQGLTRTQSRDGARQRYLAVINEQTVETGDRVSIELEGVRYRWRVKEISSTGVELEKMDAQSGPGGGTGGK